MDSEYTPVWSVIVADDTFSAHLGCYRSEAGAKGRARKITEDPAYGSWFEDDDLEKGTTTVARWYSTGGAALWIDSGRLLP